VNASVVLVATVAAVLAVDVLTKAAALRLPAAGVGHPAFGLRLVLNRRAGMPGVSAATATAVLALLTMTAAGLVVAADASAASAAGIGLAVGGAVGNAVDRLRRGGVVDFVVVGRWPVFNVADVALVAGVVGAVGSVVA
jgi:signal peptidase II